METKQKSPISQFLNGATSLGELVDSAGMSVVPEVARNLHHRWSLANGQNEERKEDATTLLSDILMRDAVRFGGRYMRAVSDLWTDKNLEQVREALQPGATKPSDEIVHLAQEILKHNR